MRLAEGDDVGLIKRGYQRACDAVDTGSLVGHPNLRSENRGGEQQHDRKSATSLPSASEREIHSHWRQGGIFAGRIKLLPSIEEDAACSGHGWAGRRRHRLVSLVSADDPKNGDTANAKSL